MDNRKHKRGDIVILSPDLQKKRNVMFGIKPDEKPMYDLSPMAEKIVVFDRYDSLHKEWACRVSGQKFLEVEIFQYLIPESAIVPIQDKIKKLVSASEIKGIYKHVLKDPNVDLVLFMLEVAQQANSPLGSKGIEGEVGLKLVEFSRILFPNAELGTTVKDFYKI